MTHSFPTRRSSDLGRGGALDSIRSHQNFCAKHGFRFDLVSDADEALCRAFDVIHEQNMYGRKVIGLERSTFLVDPRGSLARARRKETVPGHAPARSASLNEAQSSAQNQHMDNTRTAQEGTPPHTT